MTDGSSGISGERHGSAGGLEGVPDDPEGWDGSDPNAVEVSAAVGETAAVCAEWGIEESIPATFGR
ncbi:hypothetical protein ACWDR0_15435 [Streptomyces sp. NPDC003691]